MTILASWSKPIASALVLALGLALFAPDARAASVKPKAQSMTLAKAAELHVANTSSAELLAQTSAAPSSSEGSGGFFRTKKGVVVLVLLGGVIAWTAVSRGDAIHSPERK